MGLGFGRSANGKTQTGRRYYLLPAQSPPSPEGAKRVALLLEQGADAVGIGQTVRRWLRWTTAGLDGCLRWTETQLPLGCESVSGMVLPGRLSLGDPDTMLSGTPAVRSHATPAAVASCGQPRGFGPIRKPPRNESGAACIVCESV